MKRCIQCGQTLTDETRFCFKCGGGNFEPTADAGGYKPPTYQQPVINTYIQQPAYQAQPAYVNNEPATVGNFLIFFLLMLVPIFNLVYLIIVAVGGPRYKRSMTSFARALLIWAAIMIGLYVILILIFGVAFWSFLGGGYYY